MTPDEAWAAFLDDLPVGWSGSATLEPISTLAIAERHRPIIEAAIRASEPPDVARLREAAQAVVSAWIDDESGMETFNPQLIDKLSAALAKSEGE